MKKIIVISFILTSILTESCWGQESADKLKALWIIQNFAPNIKWTNENAIKEYTIGVYGKDTKVYEHLVAFAKNNKIKGKKYSVVQFEKLSDIDFTHILYVEPQFNTEIALIDKQLKFNTLLITDQCTNVKLCMLNLFDLANDRKKFEINKDNASKNGIAFLKNIIIHAGVEQDLRSY